MDDLSACEHEIYPSQGAQGTEQIQGGPDQVVESKAINPEVLAKLRSSLSKIGSQAFIDVINAYLDESESRIAQMQQALREANLTQLQLAAHTLKSSSALVGAVCLSSLCQQLEEKSHQNQPPNAYEMLALIEAEYNQVKVALEAELTNH